MRNQLKSSQGGFTFIELIFVTLLSVMVFGAVLSSFVYTLELVTQNRANLSALSLANERMEFFRSLPYDNVGTVTGIVRGPVENNQSLMMNGLVFTERIVIDYVDGIGDGIGGADSNAILEDYKQVKLEYTWELKGESHSLALVSNIMPRSIESDVGGGSIRVNVLDQDFMPLPGARVQFSNASATAPLYESRLSNASGIVLLSGVPVDSNYELVVGGPIGGTAYSTSSTWIADSFVANPSSPAFAVSEAGISTQTFIIDALSDIVITSLSALSEDFTRFSFADVSGIATSTNTTVVGSSLVLEDTLGVYETNGTAYLTPITPAGIESWKTISIAAAVNPGTDYVIRLYSGDAMVGYTPIPDAELPGNGLGFTDSLIDISALDIGLYSTTTIGVTLTTTDTSITPEIEEVAVYWRESSTARSGQTLFVRGNKILGTDTGGSPIYKATSTVTTNGSGIAQLPDMEFDYYTATTTDSLDLASACPAQPFLHRAGDVSELEFLFVPSAAQSLRIMVSDTLGRAVPGVEVRLSRPGYDVTQLTNSCGQTFFTGGLSDETDYDLSVSAPGYTNQTVTPFTVSGDTTVEITL
jgi:hypothetical protein